MSFVKDKFEVFIETKEIPNISTLKIHNKISQFLDGTIPDLTTDEKISIKNFLPHETWSKFNLLTIDVIDEIKWNVVNHPIISELRPYLDYLLSKLFPINESLKSAIWFNEINELSIDILSAMTNSIREDQISTFNLLRDLLWRSNRYYYTQYNSVEEYISSCLINITDVKPKQVYQNPFTIYFEKVRSINEKYVDDKSLVNSTDAHTDQLSNTKQRKNINEHSQALYGLLHYYLSKTSEGPAINGDNQDKFAVEYGFYSKNSGKALQDEFNNFKDLTHRTSLILNKRSDNKKKERFEIVIELFLKQKKIKSLELAKDEYDSFVNRYNANY